MNRIDDHNLYHEFPEYEVRIRELVNADAQFAGMAGDYHELDAEIRSLEERNVPTSDVYFEDLKKKRAHLKDRVYAVLHLAHSASPNARALA